MPMIRIAQVVEDLKIGGIEKVIENITMFLDPQLFKVHVICLSRGGEVAEGLIANGKDVEILHIRNYHSLSGIMKVAGRLRRKEIDIVHTHAYPAGVLGRVAAVLAGVPRILHHLHSTRHGLSKRNCLIERILSRHTSAVLCCSKAVEEFASRKVGIPRNKLTVLYNGVPEFPTPAAEAVRDLKRSLGLVENGFVIGCVASLTEHKGHKYLLEALARVDDARLVLVGDGPLRKELKGLTHALDINDRVVFAGYQMDISLYLALMDIVVLPSSEGEGFGIALIEAMSASKPVIGSSIGGIPEIIDHGATGLLVRPKDSDALAGAIRKLLDSPALICSMGLKGRQKYIRDFTLHKMLQNMGELYAARK